MPGWRARACGRSPSRPGRFKQRQRLTALFAGDEHVQVEATWGIYQHMIAAHREPDPKRGRELMQQLIGSIGHSVPTPHAR